MIKPDSIGIINDSARIARDSIAKLDSISVADSLKAIIHAPQGFIGIPHPSIAQTEGWVFSILIVFFFLLIYSVTQSIGLISDTVKNFFQVKERSSIFSKANVNESRFKFFLLTFSIGVLSFYVYLFLHRANTPFSIKEYGLILVVTGLFFALKSFIFNLIGYVFINSASLKMAKDAYFNIVSFLGVILFPLLFLQIYSSVKISEITAIISIIISLIACIFVIIKLFQIFFNKLLASFYIFLYLCTLEFLPLVILYKVYQLIV